MTVGGGGSELDDNTGARRGIHGVGSDERVGCGSESRRCSAASEGKQLTEREQREQEKSWTHQRMTGGDWVRQWADSRRDCGAMPDHSVCCWRERKRCQGRGGARAGIHWRVISNTGFDTGLLMRNVHLQPRTRSGLLSIELSISRGKDTSANERV